LIGPNGSGKTTLFNCLSGALLPTAGSIRFRGEELAGLTPDAVCHRGIARTFQIPRPFRKLTVLDNVAVAAHFGNRVRGSPEDARARAREMLTLVGLAAEAGAAPGVLGAAGLKKLEVARALATGPALLLADESLGGLDPGAMHAAAELLRRIRVGMKPRVVSVECSLATPMAGVDRVVVRAH